MTQMQGFGRKYIKGFLKGFFVAVPVTVTFLDRVACIARVEGTSMQVTLGIMASIQFESQNKNVIFGTRKINCIAKAFPHKNGHF
uniref:Uncharacterized protein n=1 Tax=Laticauda laticaudata TaxID=8630 RepID=A0A8C5WN51_LATLA